MGLALVVALAVLVRCRDADSVLMGDGVWLADTDTVRRLVRLCSQDAAASTPLVETLDGFPEGCISHWTLPMDWVLRLLDPVARPFLPQARAYEAGAVVAGPLLAVASLLVLVLGLRRLLGHWQALLAGAFYACSYSVVNVSWLGNGDHQNLQHLCLVIGSILGLVAGEERRAGSLAVLSGAAFGLAVWISAESLLFAGLVALAGFVLSFRRDEEPVDARRELLQAGACLAVVTIGHATENRGDLGAMAWDKVSWLQILPVLSWVVLAALRRRSPLPRLWRNVVGAAAALAITALPIALLPGGGLELAKARDASRWLREVSEYRGLFADAQGFDLGPAIGRDTWLVLLLPVSLVSLVLARGWRPQTRWLATLTAVLAWGLELAEVKLAHMFALAFPFVLVGGAQAAIARLRASDLRRGVQALFAVAAVAAAWSGLPEPRSRDPVLAGNDAFLREICGELRRRAAGDASRAVLAPWDMGAHVMHYAGLPVTASGYHRNLAGILDAYRVFLTPPEEDDGARRVLDRRRVRFVVAWYSREFLRTAPALVGLRVDDVRRTLFWRLRYDAKVPGFTEFATGPLIGLSDSPQGVPAYRIFER